MGYGSYQRLQHFVERKISVIVKLARTRPAHLDYYDQSDRLATRFVVHSDLLRYTVVGDDKITRLEREHEIASSCLNQGRDDNQRTLQVQVCAFSSCWRRSLAEGRLLR